jgi:hypothetical protein
MFRNYSFWFFFAASVIVACLGGLAPVNTMPYDYSAIVSRTIPLAIVWGAIVVSSVFVFHKRALWLLVGAPIVLYWPVWLLVNG